MIALALKGTTQSLFIIPYPLLTMKNKFVLLMFCAVVCCAGCAKSNVPISGTVSFEDGTPLEIGVLVFTNGTYQGRSNLETGGKFTIGMLSEGDGLAPGQYKIYVSGAESVAPSPKGGMLKLYTPLVAPKFTSAGSTPIEMKIDKGNESLDIKIEKAKGKDAEPIERM
jgi:hypothetical protein